MAKDDWRIGLRFPGRDESSDPLIRKSIVERKPGTTQIFFDRGVVGFGLKITSRDHASFVFQKRVPGLRWPKRWTLEARSVGAARAEAASLAAGHYQEVAERPPGNPETLREVYRAYLAFRGPEYRSRR